MLHVSTKVEQRAVVVVELSGRFNFHAMEHFLSALDHAEITYLPQHVILDLSQINFIDPMTIGRIVTTGQHGQANTTLKEFNFEAMVPTVATVEDALALRPWEHFL